MPLSAISDRNRWPSLRMYERTAARSLVSRSVTGLGGQNARVSAMGPNWRSLAPDDFHVPLPRLQSIRTLTRPSVPKATVYFVLSSGVSVLSSLPWNFTSCQDVPGSGPGAFAGGAWASAADVSRNAPNRMIDPVVVM